MANSRATFTVDGVVSADDGEQIENALADLEGVQLAVVDVESREVEVRHGEELVSTEEIKSTVRELGYNVDEDDTDADG